MGLLSMFGEMTPWQNEMNTLVIDRNETSDLAVLVLGGFRLIDVNIQEKVFRGITYLSIFLQVFRHYIIPYPELGSKNVSLRIAKLFSLSLDLEF